MPLDAICLGALVNELTEQIIGMKIDRIQQPEQDLIVLSLRGYGTNARLLVSAGAGDARLHLTESNFENPQNPPMFCMLLRKHLLGARIKSITQPPLERAVDLLLEGADALGDIGEKHLILELMGRYSNIILTRQDGMIIDCLRRVDILMSEKRQVLPGLYYHLPPVQDKRDPMTVTREEWMELLAECPPDKASDKWLLDTFNGFSPLVCREIVSRAYGETDTRIFEIRVKARSGALCDAFFSLISDIAGKKYVPWMLLADDGKPREFSYTAVRQYGGALKLERQDSFSILLETFYTRRYNLERMRQRSQALLKSIKTAHDRTRRKLEIQREEFIKTRGRERLRELGDILSANMHALRKGMAVFRTQDYYAEDGKMIEIQLDPLKSPQQNAAKYYKEYSKAKNAESVLSEQIARGADELIYLTSVLEEIARAESERDLDEIRQELTLTGYLRQQKQGKKDKKTEGMPMRFVSSSGCFITIGKNNVQNELLTHKTAFKSDVWLHAQKIPGAHAVISANGTEPDAQTLNEAANLAAWFSEARYSKKVPVDYTLVKNVKKIPGGRPGMVTYTDYKTIIAAPDEALAEKLRAK